MKFRRQRLETVDVNLTPLIDVVFLLLIFFMVSTTFTRETHLAIDLPEAEGKPTVEEKDQVEVLVNESGHYTVNSHNLIDNRIDTLKSAIHAVSAGDTELPLIISADAQAPHQSVVRAMDAAGQLGFVHLSITTIQPRDDAE